VTDEEISKGDDDIENPLAIIYGKNHPELMEKYAVR
jgi:hypothetical protein